MNSKKQPNVKNCSVNQWKIKEKSIENMSRMLPRNHFLFITYTFSLSILNASLPKKFQLFQKQHPRQVHANKCLKLNRIKINLKQIFQLKWPWSTYPFGHFFVNVSVEMMQIQYKYIATERECAKYAQCY